MSNLKTENIRNVRPEVVTEHGKSYLNLEFECDSDFEGSKVLIGVRVFKIDLQTFYLTSNAEDNSRIVNFDILGNEDGNLAVWTINPENQ
jgi:hypothetical protein